MKEVTYSWEESPFAEGDIVQCRMQRSDIKQVKIKCTNHSKKTVTNMRVRTNLPAEAYSLVMPKRVLPERSGTILLNLQGSVLWDDKVDGVALEFAHDLIKDTST